MRNQERLQNCPSESPMQLARLAKVAFSAGVINTATRSVARSALLDQGHDLVDQFITAKCGYGWEPWWFCHRDEGESDGSWFNADALAPRNPAPRPARQSGHEKTFRVALYNHIELTRHSPRSRYVQVRGAVCAGILAMQGSPGAKARFSRLRPTRWPVQLGPGNRAGHLPGLPTYLFVRPESGRWWRRSRDRSGG